MSVDINRSERSFLWSIFLLECGKNSPYHRGCVRYSGQGCGHEIECRREGGITLKGIDYCNEFEKWLSDRRYSRE